MKYSCIINFPHLLALMAFWLFLHNTTSHIHGVLVPQMSLSHRTREERLISGWTYFRPGHALTPYSKTSPSASLLFHFPPSSLFSWPPRLSFLATITVFFPCSSLLGSFKKVEALGNIQSTDGRLPPSFKGFSSIPLKLHTGPRVDLELPKNTPSLRPRLPSLHSFSLTHFSACHSYKYCPSSASLFAVPCLSLYPLHPGFMRFLIKMGTQGYPRSMMLTYEFLFLWLSESQHVNPWTQLPHSCPLILLVKFTWTCWLAP